MTNGFKGRFITRKDKRENNENINPMNNLIEENIETLKAPNMNPKPTMGFETNREKKIRIFKLNSSRILHERNKYVFLASVAERAISLRLKLSDILGFVLIKKLFKMLCYLRYILQNKVTIYKRKNKHLMARSTTSSWNYGASMFRPETSKKSPITFERSTTYSRAITKT